MQIRNQIHPDIEETRKFELIKKLMNSDRKAKDKKKNYQAMHIQSLHENQHTIQV